MAGVEHLLLLRQGVEIGISGAKKTQPSNPISARPCCAAWTSVVQICAMRI